MKLLKSLIFISLLFPINLTAEMVCLHPSGCPIEEDGTCVGCVWKEPKIKEECDVELPLTESTVKESKKLTPATTPSSNKCIWRCVIAPCDDDMLPDGCVWREEV